MTKFVSSIAVVLAAGFLIVTGIVYFRSSQDIPHGEKGPAASALAQEILMQTKMPEWKKSDGIQFTVDANGTTHFFDRKRSLYETSFAEDGASYRIQFNSKEEYLAYKNDELLDTSDSESMYRAAEKQLRTDLFWLNPFSFINDKTLLEKIGERALLIRFPERNDDTYLIVTDENKMPTHWKMWTRDYPLQGMETSFDEWKEFSGGVKLSLLRINDFQEIRFTNVRIYETYPAGTDRFTDFLKTYPAGD